MNDLSDVSVAVLVEDLFEDLELWYPVIRMREAGARVVLLGGGKDEYHGKHGLSARPDGPVESLQAKDLDALIIPGGYSPDRMRRHRAMVELVANAHKAGKIVAAICHAGWMLVSADIIRGRTVTSYFSIKDDLVNAGGNWVDKEVVVDGCLVTSRTPDDLPAFMRAIIGVLAGDRP